MDIFTTQLTKVRQTPIRPEKLRVKSLNKDVGTRALDDEKDHIEESQRDIAKAQQFEQHYSQAEKQQAEPQQTQENPNVEESLEKSSASKDDDDKDRPLEHLDIYI